MVGRADLIERARRDPLARALRLGRLPLVALEATLACYLEGQLDHVPALAAMRMPLDTVRARAEQWKKALEARGITSRIVELKAAIGGGALAETPLASVGVALETPHPDALSDRLRAQNPPVVGRIHDGVLVFDARTVLPGEDDALLDAITSVVRAEPEA